MNSVIDVIYCLYRLIVSRRTLFMHKLNHVQWTVSHKRRCLEHYGLCSHELWFGKLKWICGKLLKMVCCSQGSPSTSCCYSSNMDSHPAALMRLTSLTRSEPELEVRGMFQIRLYCSTAGSDWGLNCCGGTAASAERAEMTSSHGST